MGISCCARRLLLDRSISVMTEHLSGEFPALCPVSEAKRLQRDFSEYETELAFTKTIICDT